MLSEPSKDPFRARDHVAEFDDVVDVIRALSHDTRLNLRSDLNVSYGNSPAETLDIFYPPSAATVDLLKGCTGDLRPVTLRAQGGKAPLRWIVNGQPLPTDGGPDVEWQPDGPGFVQVTIIDGNDRASHSMFRLRPTGEN